MKRDDTLLYVLLVTILSTSVVFHIETKVPPGNPVALERLFPQSLEK